MRSAEFEKCDLADDVDVARDHVRGPEDAPVTLVEYADFECSFCGEAEGVVRELLAMTHQQALTDTDLARYAETLGLDAVRFRDDLRLHVHAARVMQDVESASASGVPGTPTFFVNVRRHDGAHDVDSLGAAVRAARSRLGRARQGGAA